MKQRIRFFRHATQKNRYVVDNVPMELQESINNQTFYSGMDKVRKKPVVVHARRMPVDFEVETLEGRMEGKAGDYLICGVNGEFYPCDAEIFEKTYETVEDNNALSKK